MATTIIQTNVNCKDCHHHFDSADSIREDPNHATCLFLCKHHDGIGSGKQFRGAQAILAHLANSPLHGTSLHTNMREKATGPSSRVLPAVGQMATVPYASSSPSHSQNISVWTTVSWLERASALASLTAKVHTPADLARFKYNRVEAGQQSDLLEAPHSAPGTNKRRVIALDCEMVVTASNDRELARLTVIDYLTAEVLIDRLVQPAEAVLDWKTHITGISAISMSAAVADNSALLGWRAARATLCNLIDTQTILVGHGLENDLRALRLRHTRIVDSAILTWRATRIGTRRWRLPELCKDLLGKSIRNGPAGVHDALEDAFAAREVVLFCINQPTQLKAWATEQKTEAYGRGARGKKTKPLRRQQPLAPARVPAYFADLWANGLDQDDDDDDDDDDEFMVMSQEEFNEMCGYPVWYDNWD